MTIVLAGQVYGELKVLRPVGRDKHYHEKWECLCSCGKTTVKYDTNLLRGRTLDCDHCAWDKRYPKLYAVWSSMKARCNNPSHHAYKDYGGRGITVCIEWNRFKTFFDDMGIPDEGLSLDRIDNNKGYSKENCKWSTKSEQAYNRRPKSLKPLELLSPTSKRAIAAARLQPKKLTEAELNWLRLRNLK